MACYKKLMGQAPDLDDLLQYNPQVGKSMQALLNNDSPTLKDELYMTFTYEYESWGERKVVELKEGGSNIYVSQENKEEYVELFIDYVFNKQCEKFFDYFSKGFHKVCQGDLIGTFEPEELELLICGSTLLDFNALREAARYQDGFDEDSPGIQRFWEVLLEFTEEEKKKFLMFTTGCDRAPIKGLSDLRITISKHGDDESKLPSVHTCFNHLLLPDYKTVDTMGAKIKQAIENSEGFGLI